MFNSKTTSLLVLGIAALICSRAIFFFINDPEGPNLLVVVVAAGIIFALLLGIYLYLPRKK